MKRSLWHILPSDAVGRAGKDQQIALTSRTARWQGDCDVGKCRGDRGCLPRAAAPHVAP